MHKKAILIGALDTKGNEFLFVKQKLEQQGIETFTINTGILGKPVFAPDAACGEVARRGGSSLSELRNRKDRAVSISVMTEGASRIVSELLDQKKAGALYSMGRVAGTTIGAAVMQRVPIGIPKLIVSTVASGDVRSFVGCRDIMMMFSVVDIIGLNSISKRILSNAAYALAGMMKEHAHEQQLEQSARAAGTAPDARQTAAIGVTVFGSTTPCVSRIRADLEHKGYDVLVFHATGAGGQAMEQLIREGYIKGVADVTTTELADELLGGIFSAGQFRLEAAGEAGIPQVVSVGALDSVNFGAPETVPKPYLNRKLYSHNPTTTLMRTSEVENFELGRLIAKKLNKSTAPVLIVFPKGGVSSLDFGSQPFAGEPERNALLEGLKRYLRDDIPLLEIAEDINHPAAAELIANSLSVLLKINAKESEDTMQ